MVPQLHREDIREVFLHTYRIVYRVREQTIDVLTAFEGHRRFDPTELPELDRWGRRDDENVIGGLAGHYLKALPCQSGANFPPFGSEPIFRWLGRLALGRG
jgi:hypothetical protein